MAYYCTISAVRTILRIDEGDLTFDAELEACVASASAIVDALLMAEGLSVPTVVPQLVADAAAHYAAWMFRRRRDPEGAEAFWVEAERLLTTYIAGESGGFWVTSA
ncbi:MAG: hypothetical protein NWE99_10935 [Candidatus Bathyarchaeota archaeon]|nr:hypothetical protein [Candidatus Bathyarchaeota archaeon]